MVFQIISNYFAPQIFILIYSQNFLKHLGKVTQMMDITYIYIYIYIYTTHILKFILKTIKYFLIFCIYTKWLTHTIKKKQRKVSKKNERERYQYCR